MPGRLSSFLLLPKRYPFRFLLAVSLLGVSGYLLWEMTPGVRLRREFTRQYGAAQQALSEFDFADARLHLDECIRLRPDDPSLRLMAAQAARRDGDSIAANQHLDEYRQFFGEVTPEERLEWSLQQAQAGKFANVIDYLLECLEVRHPSSERIFEALALGCVHVYNLDLASFWVRRTLDKYPRNPVARLIRLQTSVTLGQRAGLLPPLRELVAEFPRYTQARQQLAEVLLAVREYDEAAKEYESLYAQVHERAFWDYLTKDPAKQFETRQAKSPEEMKLLLGLARCRIKAGRPEMARPLLTQLCERFADNSEALLECGRFAIQEDRLADAESLLRRAVELAPFDHEIHIELGICFQRLNKPELSEPHVNKAKQIESDLGLLEKAVEATIKNPVDPEPRFRAGAICLRNGQVSEGLRWFYGVLERNPDHKATHRALADYYTSQGDNAQAEQHRRKAR